MPSAVPSVIYHYSLQEFRSVSHSYPLAIRKRYVNENHEIRQSILGDKMYSPVFLAVLKDIY